MKYATSTSSPMRKPPVTSGLYDLNIKKLEVELAKLKPVI